MSEDLGVSVKREEDFSKWYLDVVRKGNFIDQRSPIKGFDVILPWGYAIWEEIQKRFDTMLKEHDVKNAYFPMFIPEHLIKKEEEHFKGFKAETFVVTEAGGEKLDERLYVRPTSETIMYYMYSLWIRSYKDLPLKINQWNNVIRFDTKVTKPFLRGREFVWSEAHTAHATREDAVEMVNQAVGMYSEIYKMMAIEPLIIVRPQSDTFAGADFSVVFDTLLQDGKVAQGPGTHMLGQHFSKPFNIQYLDKQEKKQYVWQTSWGISTRQLGILIMHHGDDKGAILPPELSPIQVVIVPIMFKGKESVVIEKAKEAEDKIKKLGLRAYLDDRDYTAGFKFNEWELKGVPLRIEIGPRDVEGKEVTVVNRVDNSKTKIKMTDLQEITNLLNEIQGQLLNKSRKFLSENITDAKGLDQLRNLAKKGFWMRANWCGADECEKNIKSECGGAEIRGTLYKKEETPFGKCVYCNKDAKHVVYIAKAY
ncbi:MAG: proline--tRNA ligase [Candidatus Aenigmarchaeota archaeon]|nr:proline--tRNA ligase [Candidatus Aenigmarchaeota archaeon]